ncbi:unnamed protein product [Amoebophrya sp. A120]|nr:unnamed protein product [Amoebophrya sp. A120]|eukprot:GSA120T00003901001.1
MARRRGGILDALQRSRCNRHYLFTRIIGAMINLALFFPGNIGVRLITEANGYRYLPEQRRNKQRRYHDLKITRRRPTSTKLASSERTIATDERTIATDERTIATDDREKMSGGLKHLPKVSTAESIVQEGNKQDDGRREEESQSLSALEMRPEPHQPPAFNLKEELGRRTRRRPARPRTVIEGRDTADERVTPVPGGSRENNATSAAAIPIDRPPKEEYTVSLSVSQLLEEKPRKHDVSDLPRRRRREEHSTSSEDEDGGLQEYDHDDELQHNIAREEHDLPGAKGEMYQQGTTPDESDRWLGSRVTSTGRRSRPTLAATSGSCSGIQMDSGQPGPSPSPSNHQEGQAVEHYKHEGSTLLEQTARSVAGGVKNQATPSSSEDQEEQEFLDPEISFGTSAGPEQTRTNVEGDKDRGPSEDSQSTLTASARPEDSDSDEYPLHDPKVRNNPPRLISNPTTPVISTEPGGDGDFSSDIEVVATKKTSTAPAAQFDSDANPQGQGDHWRIIGTTRRPGNGTTRNEESILLQLDHTAKMKAKTTARRVGVHLLQQKTSMSRQQQQVKLGMDAGGLAGIAILCTVGGMGLLFMTLYCLGVLECNSDSEYDYEEKRRQEARRANEYWKASNPVIPMPGNYNNHKDPNKQSHGNREHLGGVAAAMRAADKLKKGLKSRDRKDDKDKRKKKGKDTTTTTSDSESDSSHRKKKNKAGGRDHGKDQHHDGKKGKRSKQQATTTETTDSVEESDSDFTNPFAVNHKAGPPVQKRAGPGFAERVSMTQAAHAHGALNARASAFLNLAGFGVNKGNKAKPQKKKPPNKKEAAHTTDGEHHDTSSKSQASSRKANAGGAVHALRFDETDSAPKGSPKIDAEERKEGCRQGG